jgi:signal transduction histidine kinase
MKVQDEGKGVQPAVSKDGSQPLATPGVGIAGMRERVRQLGGELEIHSTASGTLLKAVIPLK